jgi:hypothetical protein
MASDPQTVFPEDFRLALRTLVNVHHSIYRRIPPQGIYFEALVEEAFSKIKKPFTVVTGTGLNRPEHDLLVEHSRLSLKTETGAKTHPTRIAITKLCTTEREPWTAPSLVARVLEHLRRYDHILMLRAVWRDPGIHYQLLDVPIDALAMVGAAEFAPVGRRTGRQSLGADVSREGQFLFHAHFDGADGKCQVRRLGVEHCVMLSEWDLRL